MTPKQMPLPLPELKSVQSSSGNRDRNKLHVADRAFHNWYRFVLSFPPHLVQDYIEDFGLNDTHTILDPFCGTGTTLIEAKVRGIASVGLEAHPFAAFASSVKLDWSIDTDALLNDAYDIAHATLDTLKTQGIDDDRLFEAEVSGNDLKTLSSDLEKLLVTNSISPLPLHKTLVLLHNLGKYQSRPHYQHLLLALANALVNKISNLHFGPEVGVGKLKQDAPVVSAWLSEINKITKDVNGIESRAFPISNVYSADARQLTHYISPQSIDAVITSPPYPNEKDYTRTTRLEAVILGFIKNKSDLQALKRQLIRSNTRGIYKGDDDDKWVANFTSIQRLADSIEQRRLELGKTSGFERLYSRVTRLYFGGIAQHLSELRAVLRPGANLAYVVGDQASYLRVMIPTGKLVAEIAQSLGYEIMRVDLFRTRLATATREQLREEVVVMKWTG